MSWNGLDIVVFYESARGDNGFGQTAIVTEESLSWISVGAGEVVLLTNILDVEDQ